MFPVSFKYNFPPGRINYFGNSFRVALSVMNSLRSPSSENASMMSPTVTVLLVWYLKNDESLLTSTCLMRNRLSLVSLLPKSNTLCFLCLFFLLSLTFSVGLHFLWCISSGNTSHLQSASAFALPSFYFSQHCFMRKALLLGAETPKIIIPS